MFHLMLLVLFVLSSAVKVSDADEHKCEANLIPEFRNCTSENNTIFPVSKCRDDIDVCNKTFNVSLVHLEPFSAHEFKTLQLPILLSSLLNTCCGPCTKTSTINKFKDMTEVTISSINTSRMVFPILGRHNAKKVFGYHFLPMLDVPGGYYITEIQSGKKIVERLVNSGRNLWPLLVIMLLLSTISGFFIWIMETGVNPEEFPRSFFIGLFDGFWWSFISMTTVGYGDKSPKCFLSRLFSVAWILIGITICSMFTASLITELASLNSPPTPDIEGNLVGVLKHRLFDAIVIARGGGAIYESQSTDLKNGIEELINKTKSREIHGFFLDKYTFMHSRKYHNFIKDDSVKTKIQFNGEGMAYGIILKNIEDSKFFKDFVDNNRDIFETCKRLEMNVVDNNTNGEDVYLFSSDGAYFKPMLIGTAGAVLVLVCVGIIYEIIRKQCCRCDNNDSSNRGSKDIKDIMLLEK